MPRPKIPVEDRLEIQELFAYYAWGLNTGDADEVVACFTDDCEFEHLPQGIFRGHDQLRCCSATCCTTSPAGSSAASTWPRTSS